MDAPAPVAPKAFRLSAKKVFLTYPQCGAPLPLLRAFLAVRFEQWEPKIVVAHEDHKDGTPHRHAFIVNEKKVNIRDARYCDFTHNDQVYHPNVQGVRNPKKCLEYVLKGKDFIVHPSDFDPETLLNSKGKKVTDAAAQIILDGGTYHDIVEYAPGFAMMNQKHINTFIQYRDDLAVREDQVPWNGIVVDVDWSDTEKDIADWLETNILKKRAFKQPQLYLWSEGPNMLKTSLLRALERFMRVYYCNTNERYTNFSENADLYAFDEFCGKNECPFMNKFLQGGDCDVPVKGGAKKKYCYKPVIICSNVDPDFVYNSQMELATFAARFRSIKITQPIAGLVAELERQASRTLSKKRARGDDELPTSKVLRLDLLDVTTEEDLDEALEAVQDLIASDEIEELPTTATPSIPQHHKLPFGNCDSQFSDDDDDALCSHDESMMCAYCVPTM